MDHLENARSGLRVTDQELWNSAFGQGDPSFRKESSASGEFLWLVQGSLQCKVLPHVALLEKKRMVPRAEWPNRRSSGVLVACQRRQGCGERVPEEYLTLGAGVACYMSQEGGKWVYECQGTSGSQMGRGLRCVALTPVVFLAERVQGTPEIFGMLDKGGRCSTRSFRSEQTQRRKQRRHGGPTFWRLLDWTVMRRKYKEVKKELRRELKRRKETLGAVPQQ